MLIGCFKPGVEQAFTWLHPQRPGHHRAHIFSGLWRKNAGHPRCGWSMNRHAMKQYVIDELRPEDHKKIRKYLEATYGSAEMGAIYWVPIATEMLTEIQHAHTDCQPFYFAIDLEADRFALELLVRTKNRVRCACITYASKDQRSWIMGVIDAVLEKLNIAT